MPSRAASASSLGLLLPVYQQPGKSKAVCLLFLMIYILHDLVYQNPRNCGNGVKHQIMQRFYDIIFYSILRH